MPCGAASSDGGFLGVCGLRQPVGDPVQHLGEPLDLSGILPVDGTLQISHRIVHFHSRGAVHLAAQIRQGFLGGVDQGVGAVAGVDETLAGFITFLIFNVIVIFQEISTEPNR